MARKHEPRAESVRYNGRTGRVEIVFEGDFLFAFPASVAEGLRDASSRDLAAVELTPGRLGLHWERLDVDLEISGLLAGLFGTTGWMRELGRLGGRVSTPAKARAARANGAKGGRPHRAD